MVGIYGIRHRPSERIYVGGSKDILGRWRGHIKRLNRGTHSSPSFQVLWTRDGRDVFTFVVLETCAITTLVAREQAWMDFFRGRLLNASHVAKAASIDPAVARKIGLTLTGRKHTAERKTAISRSRAGVVTSAMRAHLTRLHEMLRGRPGRAHTDATKARIRESWETRRLTPVSAETRAKQSAAHKGHGKGRKPPVAHVCVACSKTFMAPARPARPRRICSSECFKAFMCARHQRGLGLAAPAVRMTIRAAVIASNHARRGETRRQENDSV